MSLKKTTSDTCFGCQPRDGFLVQLCSREGRVTRTAFDDGTILETCDALSRDFSDNVCTLTGQPCVRGGNVMHPASPTLRDTNVGDLIPLGTVFTCPLITITKKQDDDGESVPMQIVSSRRQKGIITYSCVSIDGRSPPLRHSFDAGSGLSQKIGRKLCEKDLDVREDVES